MKRVEMNPTVRRPVTVAEVSKLTGLNLKTCYDAIKRGEIPVVQIGRRKLIPRAWIEARFGSAE